MTWIKLETVCVTVQCNKCHTYRDIVIDMPEDNDDVRGTIDDDVIEALCGWEAIFDPVDNSVTLLCPGCVGELDENWPWAILLYNWQHCDNPLRPTKETDDETQEAR